MMHLSIVVIIKAGDLDHGQAPVKCMSPGVMNCCSLEKDPKDFQGDKKAPNVEKPSFAQWKKVLRETLFGPL